MSVCFPDPPDTSYSLHDPLLPWLSSIRNAFAAILTSPDDHCTVEFQKFLSVCVSLFKSHGRYVSGCNSRMIFNRHPGTMRSSLTLLQSFMG
ncbi:unnamed protein product [Rhodiola kirilowii]